MRPIWTRLAPLTLLIAMTMARAAPVVTQAATPGAVPASSFNLAVDVVGATDLYAFQFDLSYAPTLLAATAVNEGVFLPQGGTTIFLPGTIDNSSGRIGSTADTLVGAIPGVSGDGVLASISFQMLSPESSPVTLSNVILLDSRLQEIPATTAGTIITAVPEPNLFPCLMLAAVLGCCWYKRLSDRITGRDSAVLDYFR